MFRDFYYFNVEKLNKNFYKIILLGYLATFLRNFFNNNLVVSVIGSFLFGFILNRRISKSNKEILLTGFCSCFTSFSGFVHFLYKLVVHGHYVELFLCLNLIVIFNLIMMYLGFLLSRKMT